MTSSCSSKNNASIGKSPCSIDETIHSLEVKNEDLEKIKASSNSPKYSKSKTIPIYVKKKTVSNIENSKRNSIIVAHPAPEDAELQMKKVSRVGACGARFDDTGRVIPHSILGDVQNFIMYATRKGDLPKSILEVHESSPEIIDVSLKEMLQRREHHAYEKPKRMDHGENALKNWEHKMMERRRQQNYLSCILDRPVNLLAMNQDRKSEAVDQARFQQLSNANTCKMNSTNLTFDRDTDSRLMTNSRREESVEPVCHVDVPITIQTIQGLDPDCQKKPIEVTLPRTKLDSSLDPSHKPDISFLEVIGNDPCLSHTQPVEIVAQVSEGMSAMMPSGPQYLRPSLVEEEPESLIGPSLLFAGHDLKWTPQNLSCHPGIEARVTFDAHLRQKNVSSLDITNNGSAVIYYNWTKVHKQDSFGLKEIQSQVFYFNPNQGVLLPGSRMIVPFIFKSDKEGVFTERWRFNTHPRLMGGAEIIVSLKGIATECDVNSEQRYNIERTLKSKESHQVVSDILETILTSIVVPARPPSPLQLCMTEKQRFEHYNPSLEYSREKCSLLMDLHREAMNQVGDKNNNCNGDWNLEISSLKNTILQIDEDNETKQLLLDQLNQILTSMSFKTETPKLDLAYAFAYMHICEISELLVVKDMETIENMLPMPQFNKNVSQPSIKSSGSKAKTTASVDSSMSSKKKTSEGVGGRQSADVKDGVGEKNSASAVVAGNLCGEAEIDQLKEERLKRMREMNYKEKFYTQTFDMVKKTCLQFGDILSEI